jgi:hypothetical protein
MKETALYPTAREFLIKDLKTFLAKERPSLRQRQDATEIVEHYLSPRTRAISMNDVYRRALESAQNRGSSPNVISGSLPNNSIDDLRNLLGDFDPKRVMEMNLTPKTLLEQIRKDIKIKGKVRQTPRSLWPQFCESALSAATFLSRFSDVEEFEGWVRSFSENSSTCVTLPLVLSQEVHGFGFALASDFLKELGFAEYGKPDVHVKDILSGLKFTDGKSDYFCAKVLNQIANACRVTPYALDKVLWLLGSGRFYDTKLENGRILKLPSMKKEFINRFTSKLSG